MAGRESNGSSQPVRVCPKCVGKGFYMEQSRFTKEWQTIKCWRCNGEGTIGVADDDD